MAGLSNAATPRQCSFTHFFHPVVTKCIVSALALFQCMAMAGQYDGCDAELSIAAGAGAASGQRPPPSAQLERALGPCQRGSSLTEEEGQRRNSPNNVKLAKK